MEYPFVDTVVVRLHRVPGWHASGDIWPLRVSGEFYEGAIEGAEARDATGAWVEIHQRFTLRRRAFTAAELREFTGQWSRFQVGVNQFYAYRRVLEPAERERMLGYARANPEDAGFALQAAMQVLGDDVGGTGAEGRERRALVRDLLTPLARTGTPNTLILLYLSLIESREGHHFAADSIISRALAIEPDNAQILGFAAASRASVENFDGQLEALRRVTRATGDQMSQYNYMVQLLVAGKTAEMEQEAERLRTLYSEEGVDDLLHAVRMAAAAIRLDCAEVKRLAAEAPESMLELASTMLLGVATSCGDFDQAVRGLEQQWLESPTDWSTCNELAWADALRGGDMRRAEELAQLALRMSDRNAAVLNTLGLVYLQNGDLDQARAAFRECIQLDDAPSTQRMNRYMLGLCDYSAGDHERAVLQWKSVLADHPREPCLGYVVRSLDLAAAGRDPMLALTRSDPAD